MRVQTARLLVALVFTISACAAGWFFLRVAVETNWRQDVDLGTVVAGSVTQTEIIIRNVSRRTLSVREITSSCGCTVVSQEQDAVRPLGRLVFPVEVSARGKSGPFESHIVVAFNDHPPAKIRLHGYAVLRNPTVVQLGKFRKDQPPDVSFEIEASDVNHLRVAPLASDTWLTVSAAAKEGRDGVVVVRLRPEPTVPYGDVSTVITLMTSSAQPGRQDIRVTGYVLKPVEVANPVLSLGYISHDDPGSAVVKFLSPYGDGLHVADVRAEIPLQWDLEPSDRDSAVRARVSLPRPPVQSGIFKIPCVAVCRVRDETFEAPFELYGYVLSDTWRAPLPVQRSAHPNKQSGR